MSCVPQYPFRPKFVASDVKCIALTFEEHRSRLFGGGTFFRSIDQGEDRNNITLEITVVGPSPGTQTVDLFVRFNTNLVESFQVTQTVNGIGNCTAGGISALRATVTGSAFIEMLTRGTDFFDSGGSDDSTGCVSAFAEQNMTGGDGEPVADNKALINSIRTGPERTIIINTTTENSVGFPVTPSTSRRIRQFNGTEFITFSNLVAGSCPIDGVAV